MVEADKAKTSTEERLSAIEASLQKLSLAIGQMDDRMDQIHQETQRMAGVVQRLKLRSDD